MSEGHAETGPEAGTDALDGLAFEDLVAELESLTRRMAAGDIGIEEATELYERAGRVHAKAAERLERVRERIDRLAPPPDGPSD